MNKWLAISLGILLFVSLIINGVLIYFTLKANNELRTLRNDYSIVNAEVAKLKSDIELLTIDDIEKNTATPVVPVVPTVETVTFNYDKCATSSLGSLAMKESSLDQSSIKNLFSISFTYPKNFKLTKDGFNTFNKYYCTFYLKDPKTNSTMRLDFTEVSEFPTEIKIGSFVAIDLRDGFGRGLLTSGNGYGYGYLSSDGVVEYCRFPEESKENKCELLDSFKIKFDASVSDKKALSTFDVIAKTIVSNK